MRHLHRLVRHLHRYRCGICTGWCGICTGACGALVRHLHRYRCGICTGFPSFGSDRLHGAGVKLGWCELVFGVSPVGPVSNQRRAALQPLDCINDCSLGHTGSVAEGLNGWPAMTCVIRLIGHGDEHCLRSRWHFQRPTLIENWIAHASITLSIRPSAAPWAHCCNFSNSPGKISSGQSSSCSTTG